MIQDRLKTFADYKNLTFRDFERRAGLGNGSAAAIGENSRRRTFDRISIAFPELNVDWLLTGEGEMLKSDGKIQPTTDNAMELPLIPINAMAGALTGTDISFMEYDCEKYIVPIFKGAEFLIRVQGDSMFPKYASGDIVACKRVPLDRLWFQWGKTYVIDTRQGALVKRLEPSECDGCISIHSENPKYKPFDLDVEEINGVALVVGTIRAE